MKKIILLMLIIIFVVSFVKAEKNCYEISITENIILEDDYVASRNTCFNINSSNIIFDCNNHTITGPGHLVTRTQTEIWNGVPPFAGIRTDLETENITIKNCIIQEFNTGIEVFNEEGNIINNILDTNKYGFSHTTYAQNLLIEDNLFKENSETGIILYGNRQLGSIIQNNIFDKNRIGLVTSYLKTVGDRFKTGTTIVNNLFLNNKEGVSLSYLKDETFSNNNFIGNDKAITFAALTNYTITLNNITGDESDQGTGIAIMNGDNIKIKNNQVTACSTGISIVNHGGPLKNSEITNNNIICPNSNDIGMNLDGANSEVINENNIISKNNIQADRGIMIRGENNHILNNILKKVYASNYGIYLKGDSNLVEKNSILNKYGWGIHIDGNSNQIKENIITETTWEEILDEGQGNIISDNIIQTYSEENKGISKIKNNEESSITFKPYLIIQYKNEDNVWEDKSIITSGSDWIILDPGEEYNLKLKFNEYNSEKRTFYEEGNYRIKLQLWGKDGNILINSKGELLEFYDEFSVSSQVSQETNSWLQRIIDTFKSIFK